MAVLTGALVIGVGGLVYQTRAVSRTRAWPGLLRYMLGGTCVTSSVYVDAGKGASRVRPGTSRQTVLVRDADCMFVLEVPAM